MKTIIVIPARYKSSRFPGKPLAIINKIPMIIRVAEICAKAIEKKNVYVATDSLKIKKIVKKYKFNCIMTNSNCLTGTDRVAEVSKKIKSDIYVNVQGDEPLLNPNDIIKVINAKKKNFNYVINCCTKLLKNEKVSNVNIPKVVINKKNILLYMSRSSIPGYKDIKDKPKNYLKQVCIYAFNKDELFFFGSFDNKPHIEKNEDIEILRFLESKHQIKMIYIKNITQAVDTIEDIAKVEKVLFAKN